MFFNFIDFFVKLKIFLWYNISGDLTVDKYTAVGHQPRLINVGLSVRNRGWPVFSRLTGWRLINRQKSPTVIDGWLRFFTVFRILSTVSTVKYGWWTIWRLIQPSTPTVFLRLVYFNLLLKGPCTVTITIS